MIELRHLSKTYSNSVAAVSDVSLTVPRGTTTCLIGPSGCGKTTTLRMINRLVEPTAGEVRIGGRPVLSLDPTLVRRNIGYVVQDGGLLPHLTVNDNVALIEIVKRGPATVRDARVRMLLDLVGLDPRTFGGRYPAELSGGQKQRVGIARALMSDPPVLLMDEPFAALDPMLRSQLQDELMNLQRMRLRTIVLVTHDLIEAFRLGTSIVLMDHGRIAQAGTPEDFRKRPANAFVAEFVRAQTRGIE